MYLKGLELSGFKSFPDRIKIEFDEGITAVVGPNGSGKSNISDAIRWVLGEQKIKNLRGDTISDVIFSGTTRRRPLGHAKVELTLDNSDMKLPLDFSEITVTRRVFRSGESEFAINGTKCRLKDVQELFMDTGVGREGFSIIGQGRIEEILSSRSEDRRKVFHDAAGIMKFRVRRDEALLKLKKQNEHLERVDDIIISLEEEMGPLSAEAEVAETYLKLREELKDTRLKLFCLTAKNIDNELKNLLEKRTAVLSQIEGEKENISHIRNKLNECTEKYEALSKKNAGLIALVSDGKALLERLYGERNLFVEKFRASEESIKNLMEETEQKEAKKEAFKKELLVYQSRSSQKTIFLNSVYNKINVKENELAELSGALSRSEEALSDKKAVLIEKIRTESDIKSGMERLRALSEQFELRGSRIEEEFRRNSIMFSDANTSFEAIKQQLDNVLKEKNLLEEKKAEIEHESDILRDEINSIGQKTTSFEMEEKSKGARLKALLEMEREYAGFNNSVKNVLSRRADFKGICGAVGELINVPEELENAVAAALGGSVQNIITKTEHDAANIIEYLKKERLGRATFLPLSAMKPRLLDNPAFLAEKGVLGRASELIDYSEEYYPAIANLLGKVAVVRDMETGIALSKKYNSSVRMVTLAGEVFGMGGSITGGSFGTPAASIFGRTREIGELKKAISSLRKKILSEKEKARKKESFYDELTVRRDHIKSDISDANEKQNTLFTRLAEFESRLDSIKAGKNALENEKKELADAVEDVKKELLSEQTKLNELIDEMAKIDEELAESELLSGEEKAKRDALAEEITGLKLQAAAAAEEKKGIDSAAKRLSDETGTIAKELEKLKEKNEELSNEASGFREEINNITVKIHKEESKISGSQKELLLLETKIKESLEEKNASQKLFEEAGDLLRTAETEFVRIEAKAEKVSEERERMS
ncbi:MAG: chromosome segregation protein SMC, partial [Firmicutes bacterium]|nr:chromosome segregation protein SMC [Bacillota bacterium]